MPEEELRKEGEIIAAADLAAAMKANKDVNVVKCTIDGDVFLDSVTVEGRVTLRDTTFKGEKEPASRARPTLDVSTLEARQDSQTPALSRC
jgi:hypothetical protein